MIINLCGGSGGGSSAPIKLQGLIARENGTYTPDEGYDGYSEVLVEVAEPAEIFVVPDGMRFKGSTISTLPMLDTSNVTKMNQMFYQCTALQTIPQIDTSNVTTMSNMFYQCHSLQTIPIIDTSNVTDMSYMFGSCSGLISVPMLDTSNITDMSWMFSYCNKLTSIPQYDTSNVSNMTRLFYECWDLQTIPLLDCGSVTSINPPFTSQHSDLTDLGGFKNLKVSWSRDFLSHLPNLTVESLLNVINNLWDWSGNTDGKAPLNNGKIYNFGTTHSLKFGSTNLNKLTEEQIAVATAKGWTLTA